jgi:N-formylmaleamate deformylase
LSITIFIWVEQITAMATSATVHSGSNPSTRVVKHYRRIEEIIPSNWSEGTVVANGIRHYYYRTGGDKPPLVLLHGFLEGALSWLRTARALEQDYDVIMVDARGHGRSDRIATGFSQDLLTEDAAGVIRALKLRQPRLLGFSQGGTTGIHLADAHPDLVHSLIVEGASEIDSNSTDFTQSEGYQAWLSAYTSWLEPLKTQTHEERMLSALSQLPPGASLPPEDEYVAWVENCAHLDLELVRLGMTLWATLGARVNAAAQALQRVSCPVLIMKSSFFPRPGAPPSLQEEASDQSNIRIVRFVNIGHLIHREQFDQFITLVRGFFKEH